MTNTDYLTICFYILWILFLLAVAIFIVLPIVLIYRLSKRSQRKGGFNQKQSYILEHVSEYYSVKSTIMNRVEQRAFYYLQNALGDRTNAYSVFPQVCLASLLDIHPNTLYHEVAVSSVTSKSLDFVICQNSSVIDTYGRITTSFHPIGVIEIDGPGHGQSMKQKQRDYFKDKVCHELHLPLWRIPVGPDGSSLTQEMIRQIVSTAYRMAGSGIYQTAACIPAGQ